MAPSAGNTGAMFVGGFYTVKTIPGVLRPPLATIFQKKMEELMALMLEQMPTVNQMYYTNLVF